MTLFRPVIVLAVLAAALAGCAASDTEADTPDGGVDLSADREPVRAQKSADAAALVPDEVRAAGVLSVGGTIDSTPPLSSFATDNKTPVGFERDIAQVIADALDLRMDRSITSWENLFLGVDSGRYDIAFSNIAVTDERKKSYDFATYRTDLLAFEAAEDSDLSVEGPESLSGLTVALNSGTNQEDLILGWSRELEAQGNDPIDVQYYQRASDYYLALESGRVDVYVGPHPTAAYHAAVSDRTKLVGTLANVKGETAGQVAAMTVRGSGLAEAVSAAVNALIEDGTYGEVLRRWGLEAEAVDASAVNPATGR